MISLQSKNVLYCVTKYRDVSEIIVGMKKEGFTTIKVGDDVRIHGLRAYQHLNGAHGIAREWKDGRWLLSVGDSV